MAKRRVKIQRPIVSNDPDAPWLMYFEDGNSPNIVVADKDVPENIKKAMGKNYKIYVKGKLDIINGIFIFTDEDVKNAELI